MMLTDLLTTNIIVKALTTIVGMRVKPRLANCGISLTN
jgi:hypothetical protein